jgi:hypothetical protein
VASNPSPVDLIVRAASTSRRPTESWTSSNSRHRRSPIDAATAVESTMSVKATVASTRSRPGICGAPVRNSSSLSRKWSASGAVQGQWPPLANSRYCARGCARPGTAPGRDHEPVACRLDDQGGGPSPPARRGTPAGSRAAACGPRVAGRRRHVRPAPTTPSRTRRPRRRGQDPQIQRVGRSPGSSDRCDPRLLCAPGHAGTIAGRTGRARNEFTVTSACTRSGCEAATSMHSCPG